MSDKAIVSVIMGSQSDDAHLQSTYELLDTFGIAWEKRVLSAHRQPEALRVYLEESVREGIRVYIAAAGLSAALPGVVAAHTLRPVIGIPVPGGPLKGMDALLSIVQMPGGIPVATVGVGSHGPKNAAVLAAEILAISDEDLHQALEAYRKKLGDG